MMTRDERVSHAVAMHAGLLSLDSAVIPTVGNNFPNEAEDG